MVVCTACQARHQAQSLKIQSRTSRSQGAQLPMSHLRTTRYCCAHVSAHLRHCTTLHLGKETSEKAPQSETRSGPQRYSCAGQCGLGGL